MSDESAQFRLQVIQGDSAQREAGQDEWEDLYRANVVSVYRHIFMRTGNRPDAEDLTTQVFMRALPRLRSGVSSGEARKYLLVTARTVLIDFWRREYRVTYAPLDDNLPEPNPQSPPSDTAAARVALVLEQLSERDREVLQLRFLNGLSIRETAARMKITVSNAKVIQWRALRRAAKLEIGQDMT